MKHTYGWNPDIPDQRDHIYLEALHVPVFPTSVDLTVQCPSVLSQGNLGSCTANAIASALQFDQMKQQEQAFIPSRLFIYFNERVMEGTINSDAGAMIRDGIKSVAKLGACSEAEWPYDTSQFAVRPPDTCYQDALHFRALSYQRIGRNVTAMKTCLVNGWPFIFGFSVYESFESEVVAETGIVPMPGPAETVLGGHAVLCIGYDDSTQRFRCRNSWGTDWGQHGDFTIPYQYLINRGLASDFWVIRTVQ